MNLILILAGKKTRLRISFELVQQRYNQFLSYKTSENYDKHGTPHHDRYQPIHLKDKDCVTIERFYQ